MPSSTSSSESREIPTGPWLLTWLVALMLVLTALVGMESFWRSRGHRPSIVDDPTLWAYQRERVRGDGCTVVLIGASRSQLDISTPVLRELLPGCGVVQLSIDGSHAMTTLKDLAGDAQFHGTVICAATASSFERRNRDSQQEYVDHFRTMSWNVDRRFNRLAATSIQDRVVVVQPSVNLTRVARGLWDDGALPRPYYLITHGDRSRSADYALTNARSHLTHRIRRTKQGLGASPIPAPEKWLEEALEVEPWVAQIQERGGQVAFVRMPTSGEVYRLEDEAWPRKSYWDRFAAVTRAETLHFRDVPAMRSIDLPDLSHVDYRDAPAFTTALANALSLYGILPLDSDDDPSLLFELAFAHQKRGDQEQAIVFYQRLLEGTPDHRQATFNLAYAYMHGTSDQEWEKSAHLFRRVFEIYPSYTESLFHLASVLRQRGAVDEADEVDREYLTKKGTHADLRARSRARLGQR